MSSPRHPSSVIVAGRRHSGRRSAMAGALAVFTAGLALLSGGLLATPATAAGTGPGEGPGPATVQGVVERVAIDTGSGTHRTASVSTFLRSTDDQHLPVPAAALTGIPTGATVSLDPAAPAGTVQVLSAPRPAPDVRVRSVGRHTVTIVLALPRGSHRDSTTPGALSSAVTGGVSRFWWQQSEGTVSFSVARTVNWLTLSSPCSDVWAVWNEVRIKAGFAPGPRKHLMVYAPASATCPTGLGTVGDSVGSGGYALVGGSEVALLAHELGHNLGLGHSNALRCNGTSDGVWSGSTFSNRCQVEDYGDWYDVMGISWDNLGTLSTAQAFRLGLLGSGGARTVSGPAQVVLQAVSGHAGLRSLRIMDPGGGSYVVEYRPAAGADAWLATPANWRGLEPGVLVRRIDQADATQTLLLDPTPSGSTEAAGDDRDTAMTAGQSLTTGSRRVTVQVVALTATTAVVTVSVDRVSPAALATTHGKLVRGRQVTVGEAVGIASAATPL